jgi:hypothetical protein
MLPGGQHQKRQKWERVPARSAAFLRLFFTLAVLSMAAVAIMIVHLPNADPA